MLIIVACQFVAHKVRVASPLILLVVGLAIGFLPQVGAIEIEPHIVLEMVLPPLLFSAAVRMPTMDFRREMQAVAMLAIPLVFLSAFAVGFVINWLVPAISLPWGVALGAVLSPTVAATPVTACAPSVRVPVLSKSTTSMVRIRSSAIRSLMSTPDFAARSVEIAMTSGIARPKACGQAMTSTVTVRTTASSGLPMVVHTTR